MLACGYAQHKHAQFIKILSSTCWEIYTTGELFISTKTLGKRFALLFIQHFLPLFFAEIFFCFTGQMRFSCSHVAFCQFAASLVLTFH